MATSSTMRQLAAAMAFVMLMASAPSIGVIVIGDRTGPSISLDVCRPLQSLGGSSAMLLIARPAPPPTGELILSHETLARHAPILKNKLAEAPDPRPPKLFC